MKWYPYLYVGEGASKKKNKIIRKLKIGAGMIDVWVITEAANGEDQFDILSSAWLKQRAVRKNLVSFLRSKDVPIIMKGSAIALSIHYYILIIVYNVIAKL